MWNYFAPVSYTHLDVYKRRTYTSPVARSDYEAVHAMRSEELLYCANKLFAEPWFAGTYAVAGTSEGEMCIRDSNVATAMFIAWVLSFFVDLIVRRDAKKSFDLSFAMFKGMGSILTSTVGLIFVAAFFATGLQNIGIVNMLIEGAKHIGLGETGTGVFLSAVIGVVTVLTGSGVAAFTLSLIHISSFHGSAL